MGTPAPVASSFCRGCKHSFLTIKFANERQPHCQTHKNSRTSPPRRVSPYRQTVSGLDKSDSYQQLCNAVRQHSRPAQNEFDHVKMPARQRPQAVALASTVAAAALLLQGAPALAFTVHQEPDNALSFPTWVIHISSVIEWGIAMALVWKYAEVTGNSKWKGLTWGMMPLLGGALCACTYHFYYNSPDLDFLVAVQASLTWIGNATCAAAAYRIYKSSEQEGAA